MTKNEFFSHCDTSKAPLRVSWGGIYRERESAVFLHGLWGRGMVTDIQLYQPTPGRQWQVDCNRSAHLKCEQQAAKFERWLAEWTMKAYAAAMVLESKRAT